MRKWLVLFIGLLLVAAIVLVARFHKDYDTPSHGYAVKCVQPSEPPSASASFACAVNPIQNTDQGEAKPPWWHKLIAWPEGITPWLLLGTLAAIVWQAWETREAVEATRDSVQAQEKAIKLAVNAQRPYLVISVEHQLPNQFIFTAKNEGQTPARINSIWNKPLIADRDGTLQIPSDEEMAETVMSTPPQLLPPKGACTVYFCDEHRMQLMRGDAFCAVYFHGRIRYSNTLEVNPAEPYETKWLYSQLPLKGMLAIPRPDARHPEHNTWT
jgi:hypothetical protein